MLALPRPMLQAKNIVCSIFPSLALRCVLEFKFAELAWSGKGCILSSSSKLLNIRF